MTSGLSTSRLCLGAAAHYILSQFCRFAVELQHTVTSVCMRAGLVYKEAWQVLSNLWVRGTRSHQSVGP